MCQKTFAAYSKMIKKASIRYEILTIMFALVICGAAYFYVNFTIPQEEMISQINNEKSDIVIEVIDGDTVILKDNSKIRLIGINAPEKGYLNHLETKNALKSLILMQNIRLESDSENIDEHGRLLRYVFVDDVFVNLWLVEEGYAHVFRESGLKYESQLKEAENKARQQELGMWEKSRYHGDVVLMKFNYDAKGNDDENLNDEYVILQNVRDTSVNMTGWTIKDEGSNIFTFPNYILPTNEIVTLHTGSGFNVKNELFWNKRGAVWNNKGDAIYLRDEEEKLVLNSEYP